MKQLYSRAVAYGALALAAATLGGALTAQTVSDSEVPASAGLDLPKTLQIFGKADPNVRKPTAIVNGTVITGTDVDQRLAMIVALNGAGMKLSDEERDQLRLQVLRQLIDETLQIQEARANDILITPDEINQGVGRIATNLGKDPRNFGEYLRSVGSSETSFRRQIEGELAWNRLMRRRVEPYVNVGDEEVKSIIERLQAARGTEEYHLKEIYLAATPDRAAAVAEAGRKMIDQMRKGAPFEYFARNYSEATTRAVGGDLGWVRTAVLPAELANATQGMQVGEVVGPVQVPGGFSILYLADRRQVLTADPRDATLNLRQLTVRFSEGTTQAQASARAAEFAKVTQQIKGCGDVQKTADALGAEVVDRDAIQVRELPPPLQEILLKMQIGEATPPFGSVDDGIRTLVLCGRDDPAVAGLPSSEQIQSQLTEQRINLRAQRMLRDLRRDALVDYR